MAKFEKSKQGAPVGFDLAAFERAKTEDERKAAAYDAQYSSNGAWGGKEWWEDSDSD